MIDEAKIRERAYELWELAGKPEGAEQDHWRQASEELQSEQGPQEADTQRSISGTTQPGMPSGPDVH